MIYTFLLVNHIFFGSLALLGGAWAMWATKGSKAHRIGGKAFSYCMAVTALTAIFLSLMRTNAFLLAIGFFTLYLTFSGWIWTMRIAQRNKVRVHYAIATLGFASGLFLMFLSYKMNGFSSVILLVFGAIQVLMSVLDYTLPVRPDKNLVRHISKIGGAYIAATTAFLVASVSFVPPVVSWFGPTVVGTLIIAWAIRSLHLKKAKHRCPSSKKAGTYLPRL